MADLKWKCDWCGLEFESDWHRYDPPIDLGSGFIVEGCPPVCPDQDNKDTHPFSVQFSRVELIDVPDGS